jgi:hypothetical protein
VTNEQVTYLVAGASILISLGAYVSLILVPAWTSYSRMWERVAAAFLSLYVLLAFMGVGAAAGLGIAWFWDRISP